LGKLSVQNISFIGDGGTRLPAFCLNCGPTTISVPFVGMDSLSLSDTTHNCNRCGNQIHVKSAHYEFEKRIVQILAEAQITKKQAKRFARKVKTAKNINSLPASAATINKKLEAATELALKQPNPKSALTITATVAVFLASMAGGVLAADDLYDRYMRGELFETHGLQDSNNIEQNSNAETDKYPENANEQEPPDGREPIDV
jgi:hypothetical protein